MGLVESTFFYLHCYFPTEGDWKVWINTTKTAENVEVVLVVYGIVEDEDKNRCVCSGPIILGRAGENDMFATGNQDQFKVWPELDENLSLYSAIAAGCGILSS